MVPKIKRENDEMCTIVWFLFLSINCDIKIIKTMDAGRRSMKNHLE
jgi:hypothetical protein